MKFITTNARAIWALAAFGAVVAYPSGDALATGSPISGTVTKVGASVKLGGASCGHPVLLSSNKAVVRFEFWVQPARSHAEVVNSSIWQGGGEKSVYVGGCMGGEQGWIEAVGDSGKFPASATSQDQTGSPDHGGQPVRQPATP